MSSQDRDSRGFYVLLFAVLAAFSVMVLHFASVLIAAGVVTVLAWPLYCRILGWTRRRGLSVGLSFAALSLGLGGAVALVIGLVLPELGQLARDLADALQPGALDAVIARLIPPRIDARIARVLGTDLGVELSRGLQASIRTAAGGVAQAVPGLLQITGDVLVQEMVVLIALWTFLARGEDLTAWAIQIAPLDPNHSRRMVAIFASFSRNVVFAGAVGALLQGAVAGVGYAILGMDRALLFAALTAGTSVIPFVGSALVWVPLTVLLLVQGHSSQAGFLLIWSATLTSGIDNLAMPFLVRGKSDLHPLLLFLGIFGGLYSLGPIGLFLGPMLAAMLVALFTIYEERRADEPSHPGAARTSD